MLAFKHNSFIENYDNEVIDVNQQKDIYELF